VETKWIEGHRAALIAAAAVAPLLCCAVLAAFRESITTATAALVLVLLVVAAAATGDRLAGMVAALSAGAFFDVFLTQPYLALAIKDPNDIEVTVLLVVVGLAVTEIALWGRRQQARGSRRAGYLDGVFVTSKIIAVRETSTTDLISHVAAQIVEILDIDECRFVRGAGPGPQDLAIGHEGFVTRAGQRLNTERDGLPVDQRIGLVVGAGGGVHGQFLLTASTRVARPSTEQLRVAVLLADQVGAALALTG
jgi:K+-sensing histidine kinase KdpD